MEIHGFNAFGSIDATIDGVRMSVPDVPENRHRQMIAEWEAEGNIIPAYEAPPPGPYRLYRSTFVERMEPEEATLLEATLNGLPAEEAKLRLMYNAVEYFVSDDPLFAVLHWTVTEVLGEARADELLAPVGQG